MCIRDRNYSVGFIVAVVILTICISILLTLLSKPPSKHDQERTHTEHEAESYTESPGSWFVLSENHESEGSDEPESSKESKKTSRNHSVVIHENNPDIAAQEGMWRAANTLVWLTFLQMLIGTGTLVFLIRTLNTQKEELNEARNVTLSTRAFMLRDQFVINVINENGRKVLNCEIIYRNCGQTPALNIWDFVRVSFVETRVDPDPLIVEKAEPSTVKIGQGNFFSTFARIDGGYDINRFYSGQAEMLVAYAISYESVFETEIKDEGAFVLAFDGEFVDPDNNQTMVRSFLNHARVKFIWPDD